MRPARSALFVLLLLVPPAATAALVYVHHVDLPQWDQWRFPALLARAGNGEVGLRELWSQHNEHRILVPRLVTIALARASHWNTGLELAANLVFAALSLGVIALVLDRVARAMRAPAVIWLVPFASLLVFSLTQWENWLWGMEMAVFLNVLGVLAGFALLASPQLGPPRVLGAIAAGFVATASFANGLLFWPIALALLWTLFPSHHRSIATWVVASTGVIAAYLWDYETPAHTAPFTLFEKPRAHLAWFASYLGAPVAYFDRESAKVAGAIGVLAFAALAVAALRRPRPQARVLAFFVAIGLYAIGSAAITAVGRIEVSGSLASLTSRYVTFSSLLWIAVTGLLASLVWSDRATTPSARRRRAAVAVAVALLALLVARGEVVGLQWFERRQSELAPVREALLQHDAAEVSDELLQRICWSPALVREGAVELRRAGLSVYRGRRD